MSETTGATGQVTAKTVEHLASLARIALTDDEVTTLTSELSSILTNVAKVSEINLANVEATSHPIPLSNVTRPDVIADVLTIEQSLANAPDAADGMFRVSLILGEEQ